VTATDAMSRVVRALAPQSFELTGSVDIANVYRTALHQKRVLLFLDDAYDANQVETLVPPSQSCLVITSRQRILLPGASTDVLSTLSVPDSCRLLSRICPRVRDEAHEMAELCGCLPLALRLAGTALAARPDLTIDQYVQRLREERTRLELVNATVEISYQLLPQESRDAWRRLSAFRGPFDVQAAAAVLAGTERAVSDTLGNLLRHSMVEWDSASSRYSVHELLRLVADSRLGDSERDQIHLRYAEHYQDRLRSLKMEYRRGNESTLAALQQFDRDMPHIRQAIEWVRARLARGATYKNLFSLYLDAGVDIFPIRFEAKDLVAWLTTQSRRRGRSTKWAQPLLTWGTWEPRWKGLVITRAQYACRKKLSRPQDALGILEALSTPSAISRRSISVLENSRKASSLHCSRYV